MLIYVEPDADVEEILLQRIEATVRRVYGLAVSRRGGLPPPSEGLDPTGRRQDSAAWLRRVAADPPQDAAAVLAITQRDLYTPILEFVFGQAQLGGCAAVISLSRLRPEQHGFSADPTLLASRAGKEAVHELGHVFGLVHCHDATCAMALSTTVHEVDAKGDRLCERCARLGGHRRVPGYQHRGGST